MRSHFIINGSKKTERDIRFLERAFSSSMWEINPKKKGVFSMILTVFVGNIHAVIGAYRGEELVFRSGISTDTRKTDDEYMLLFRSLLELYHISPEDIDGAIIGSVVPQMVDTFSRAVEMVCHRQALVVGPGIKTGLNIRLGQPNQLGANLVCVSVAALHKYSAPCIIFDMGTATTLSALDKEGTLIGASIMPGVSVMLHGLVQKTAQLPQISLEAVTNVIGTNTVDSMKSGIIYGTASMLDGMAERCCREMGEELTVIATGSAAEQIVPHCRHQMIYDKSLLLDGLRILYEKNQERKSL